MNYLHPAIGRAGVLAFVSLLWAAVGLSQSVSFRVIRVVDGDTVLLEQVGTVRLIGVDTPETVDPRRPVEAFGREASAFLTELLRGKSVRVEYDGRRTDRYQRTLAYLYLEDGTFVNREIIRRGYGHAYTEFPFRHLEEFRSAEREARLAGKRLWAKQRLVVTAW